MKGQREKMKLRKKILACGLSAGILTGMLTSPVYAGTSSGTTIETITLKIPFTYTLTIEPCEVVASNTGSTSDVLATIERMPNMSINFYSSNSCGKTSDGTDILTASEHWHNTTYSKYGSYDQKLYDKFYPVLTEYAPHPGKENWMWSMSVKRPGNASSTVFAQGTGSNNIPTYPAKNWKDAITKYFLPNINYCYTVNGERFSDLHLINVQPATAPVITLTDGRGWTEDVSIDMTKAIFNEDAVNHVGTGYIPFEIAVPVPGTSGPNPNPGTGAGSGTIMVSNGEKNLEVNAYRLMDVNVDADGNPQEPVFKWVDEMKAWVHENYPQYDDANNFNIDVNNPDKVTEAVAGKFYDKLAAAIRKGDITLAAADTKTTDDSGAASLNGVMGNYLIVVENGMRIYSPSAVNLIPVWDDESKNWVMTTPAAVTLKSTEPTINKVITDGDCQKGIGDTVSYMITADVPHYPANKIIDPIFKISDSLSAGLTFNNNLVIKADGHELTSGTDYIVNAVPGSGRTFEITFFYSKVASADMITVEYSATVNEHAATGEAGNPNNVVLEYSNNPYKESTKEKDTTVKVFTYGVNVIKVAKETANPLQGAEFELRKANDPTGMALRFKMLGSEYVPTGGEGNTILITNADGKLSIKGLDAGDYLLTEIKAPAGYHKLKDPIAVRIADDNTNGLLEQEDGTELGGGSVEYTVKNSQGIELPVTGGIGTLLYTVGGIFLIGGAAVLLLISFRKRSM